VTNVFAIGIVGFDFGTEARRDVFRQAMSSTVREGSPPIVSPPNPYDARQLSEYLDDNPWDSNKLIWTLELDGTPVYALETESDFAGEVYTTPRLTPDLVSSSKVYRELTRALRNHAMPPEDDNYVSRVSIPGVLTTKTRRLFSGQEVPVLKTQAQGLFTWNETALVQAVVRAVEQDRVEASPPEEPVSPDNVALIVRNFLDKIYYQLRNLGQSPPDRALNFAATNAFIFAEGVRQGLLSARYVPGERKNLYTLDTIDVVKSPYCRMDSDCWDVRVTFFDAEEVRRARVVYQYTIDVSDVMPVSLAPTHRFLIAP